MVATTSGMARIVVVLPSSGDTSVTSPSLFSVTHSWSSGPQINSHGFASPWASTRGLEPSVPPAPSPPQLMETSRARPTGTAIHRRVMHPSWHGQASPPVPAGRELLELSDGEDVQRGQVVRLKPELVLDTADSAGERRHPGRPNWADFSRSRAGKSPAPSALLSISSAGAGARDTEQSARLRKPGSGRPRGSLTPPTGSGDICRGNVASYQNRP